jgi:hypothetical protein
MAFLSIGYWGNEKPFKKNKDYERFSLDRPFINFRKENLFPSEIQRPDPHQYALDPDRVDEWVAAHSEGEWREIAQKVAKNFHYISYDSWCASLKDVCRRFKEQCEKPFVLALPESSYHKSEPWVVLHALQYLENKPDYIIPSEKAEIFCLSRKEVSLFYLDDAAFTGQSLDEVLSRKRSVSKLWVFIGAPVYTAKAEAVLSEYGTLLGGQKVPSMGKLFCGKTIAFLREQCACRSKEDRLFIEDLVLTFLQHKVGDEISGFPEVINYGLFLEGEETGDVLINVEELTPPYKR